MLARLPPADVLLTHAPPAGVNDEPDDHVHRGSPRAARVGRALASPPGCCTATRCRTRRGAVHELGSTRVVHVRGAQPVDLTLPVS